MVSTFTPRLNLEKPDPDDPYSVIPHNGNMDTLDDLAGAAVIATSTTRPVPPDTYPGLLVFETDTGMLILRNPADTGWLLFTQVLSCTSGTRPTATHPGMIIYETDTGFMLIRNNANTAWISTLSGVTGFNTNNTEVSTGSTTYTNPGSMPGLTYVVPLSGQLMLHYSCAIRSNPGTTSQTAYYAPVVRQGATIGGGTVLSAASDDDAVYAAMLTNQYCRYGAAKVVVGLTPGNTINVEMAVRTNNVAAGCWAKSKKLIVRGC